MKKPNKQALFISNEYDLDDLFNQFSVQLRDHSRRVAVCSALMTEHADSFLFNYDISSIARLTLTAHLGGTCHDLGKWLNPSQPEEPSYQKHPNLGADLLQKHEKTLFDSQAEAQMVTDIVRYHHERPDGRGFPDGLQGNDIPPAAAICALADWLDHRMEEPDADISMLKKEIKDKTGSFFCDTAVICFEHAFPKIKEQYKKWNLIS